MKLAKVLLVILVVLAFVSGAFPQETNTNEGFLDRYYNQETANQGRGFWGVVVDILNILVTLVIVVAIVYVALRFIKKSVGAPVDDYGIIEVMASKALTQGVFLYIVRIGKDYFVMSSGDRGASILTKIEDKELINILNVQKSQDASKVKEDFIDTLLSLFKKKEESSQKFEKVDFSSQRIDFIKKQREKLKDWE
jgi:flagellar protein FliO/FliZ